MATTIAPESIWQRFGVPRLKGNGRFVSASLIDSLGTGLIMAFTLVYFTRTTEVSVTAVGAAMTLARLLALPTSVIVGPLIDRFTARRTAAWGNLVSVVGYLGFLVTDSVWQIVVVVLLVQIGHTTYWTSSSGLVVLASPEDRRIAWFGFMTALRNTAMGVGGALAAFAFALGEGAALHAIVIGNAASYVLASVLLLAWRPPEHAAAVPEDTGSPDTDPEPPTRNAGQQSGAGYAAVLKDASYALLIGINATLVFGQMLIKILLAIYIVDVLGLPAWTAGALIVVNAVQVSLTQTLVAKRTSRARMSRVVMLGSVLNAASFGMFTVMYATPDVVTYVGLFLAMVVFTLGEVVAFPAMENLSVTMAPSHIRGRYLATYQLSWTVGEIAAPGLLTFLLARGDVLPMLFLLGLSLVAVPLLLALERRAPTKTSMGVSA
ncbi:MFS transporter [Streptomyces sp. WMMC940]|uniref:MFS transporter n=1 Tax=Streptomyces sp. WMMC940 TaxID=3015153 RepID=UPI0022B74A21|nr:MFS transporter [Streptomyces sp. WMMC940]MCZ7462274.1 MFS transporter [Streptomyces sp. WMMC940]